MEPKQSWASQGLQGISPSTVTTWMGARDRADSMKQERCRFIDHLGFFCFLFHQPPPNTRISVCIPQQTPPKIYALLCKSEFLSPGLSHCWLSPAVCKSVQRVCVWLACVSFTASARTRARVFSAAQSWSPSNFTRWTRPRTPAHQPSTFSSVHQCICRTVGGIGPPASLGVGIRAPQRARMPVHVFVCTGVRLLTSSPLSTSEGKSYGLRANKQQPCVVLAGLPPAALASFITATLWLENAAVITLIFGITGFTQNPPLPFVLKSSAVTVLVNILHFSSQWGR